MQLTQKELADAIGVTSQQIQKYEAGINGVSLQLLIKICDTLHCNVEYFIDKIGLSDVSAHSSISNNLEDELLLAFRNIKKLKIKIVILELVKSISD